jgi:hypothetical protein
LAKIVVLAFVVVAMAGCSATQADAFDFDTDDLCEWIDVDTVEAIVADAYIQHGATPVVSGFEEAREGAHQGCWWAVPAPEEATGPGDLRRSTVGLIRSGLGWVGVRISSGAQ